MAGAGWECLSSLTTATCGPPEKVRERGKTGTANGEYSQVALRRLLGREIRRMRSRKGQRAFPPSSRDPNRSHGVSKAPDLEEQKGASPPGGDVGPTASFGPALWVGWEGSIWQRLVPPVCRCRRHAWQVLWLARRKTKLSHTASFRSSRFSHHCPRGRSVEGAHIFHCFHLTDGSQKPSRRFLQDRGAMVAAGDTVASVFPLRRHISFLAPAGPMSHWPLQIGAPLRGFSPGWKPSVPSPTFSGSSARSGWLQGATAG